MGVVLIPASQSGAWIDFNGVHHKDSRKVYYSRVKFVSCTLFKNPVNKDPGYWYWVWCVSNPAAQVTTNTDNLAMH